MGLSILGKNGDIVDERIVIKSRDPLVSDDSTQDYYVGLSWFNPANEAYFKCKNASAGAAEWVAIPSGVQGQLVQLDRLELQAHKVHKVFLVHKDRRETLDQLDQLVQLVHKAR